MLITSYYNYYFEWSFQATQQSCGLPPMRHLWNSTSPKSGISHCSGTNTKFSLNAGETHFAGTVTESTAFWIQEHLKVFSQRRVCTKLLNWHIKWNILIVQLDSDANYWTHVLINEKTQAIFSFIVSWNISITSDPQETICKNQMRFPNKKSLALFHLNIKPKTLKRNKYNQTVNTKQIKC